VARIYKVLHLKIFLYIRIYKDFYIFLVVACSVAAKISMLFHFVVAFAYKYFSNFTIIETESVIVL